MIPRLELLPIHCVACRGKGQRLQVIADAIVRADCPDCAGTGLQPSSDCSSAQPHRFASPNL